MKETINFRNQQKVGFLSDHKSQPKRLGKWKILPTHTLTPRVLRFNIFRPLGLTRDLPRARNFLRLFNNLQRKTMQVKHNLARGLVLSLHQVSWLKYHAHSLHTSVVQEIKCIYVYNVSKKSHKFKTSLFVIISYLSHSTHILNY